MDKWKKFLVDAAAGSVIGVLIVIASLFAYAFYWETHGGGSLVIGNGVLTLCRIAAEQVGGSYAIEPGLGIVVYGVAFGLANAALSAGVSALSSRI